MPTAQKDGPRPRPPGPSRAGLAAAAALSLCVGAAWAASIRPLNAPDEPSHLLALLQVRNGRMLPEVHFRFDRDPLGEVVDTPVDAAARAFAVRCGVGSPPIRLLPYESIQSPLYYVVAGLAAMAFPGDPATALYVGRGVSAAFGAGAVAAIWAAARLLAPGFPAWAWASAAFVALLPMFAFNSACVSNDSAVNFFSALAMALWVRGLRDPGYDPALIRSSAAVGLALMSKLNAACLLPGLALVGVFRVLQVEGNPGRRARAARIAVGVSTTLALIVGPWVVRNLIVYGEPTGSRDQFRLFQARYAPLSIRDTPEVTRFVSWTFTGYLGRFGWLDQDLPRWLYGQWGVVVILATAATGYAAARALRLRRVAPDAARAAAVLATVFAVLLAMYIQFNFTVGAQFQPRYLFPAILPIALVVTGGPATLPRGVAARRVALGVPLAWLALANVMGILRVIG